MIRNALIIAIVLMSVAQSYSRSLNAIPKANPTIELAELAFEDIDLLAESDTECCAKSKAVKNIHTACQFDLTATLGAAKNNPVSTTITLAFNHQKRHVRNLSMPDLKPPIS